LFEKEDARDIFAVQPCLRHVGYVAYHSICDMKEQGFSLAIRFLRRCCTIAAAGGIPPVVGQQARTAI
jgi:hypothetical protein